ncbi:MAG: hypothetical protein WAO91_05300 [Candidatus Nitrosotenuis sp.]
MSEISARSKTETTSVILALIGGSLIMVGGVLFFVWNYSWMGMSGMIDRDVVMGDMMHGMWMMNERFWFNISNMLSLSSVAAGAIVTISGLMMYHRPRDSSQWGIVALVFSVFGFLGMGGFIVGSMLGILGGILALFKK